MALEAPLRTSTGSIPSGFAPHADMSFSSGPESPALPSQYMAYVPFLAQPMFPRRFVDMTNVVLRPLMITNLSAPTLLFGQVLLT